ncbi:polysaccharide deacetylase family protein [Moniliophthora roreri]|nr:polysaccharide deacetylase family protein [Moniliophthora roreri]
MTRFSSNFVKFEGSTAARTSDVLFKVHDKIDGNFRRIRPTVLRGIPSVPNEIAWREKGWAIHCQYRVPAAAFYIKLTLFCLITYDEKTDCRASGNLRKLSRLI